jgi:hypothetical protein
MADRAWRVALCLDILQRHRDLAAGKVPAILSVVLLSRPGDVDGLGFVLGLLLRCGLLERNHGDGRGNQRYRMTSRGAVWRIAGEAERRLKGGPQFSEEATTVLA